MRAETTATSAVVTLSVAVAVVGHALAGGAVEPGVLPQLLALAGAGWLIGAHVTGRRWWSVTVLAGIQVVVHASLDAAHRVAVPAPMEMPADHLHTHGTHLAMPAAAEPAPAMHEGLSGAMTMAAAHLAVLLVGVVLVDHAHQWAARVLRILARLVPQLPTPVRVVPAVRRGPGVGPAAPLLPRWRLTSNVSRRGPPAVRVALS